MSTIKACLSTIPADLCARRDISPITENFAMSKVNDALARVEPGKARYRVVLKNDFA